MKISTNHTVCLLFFGTWTHWQSGFLFDFVLVLLISVYFDTMSIPFTSSLCLFVSHPLSDSIVASTRITPVQTLSLWSKYWSCMWWMSAPDGGFFSPNVSFFQLAISTVQTERTLSSSTLLHKDHLHWLKEIRRIGAVLFKNIFQVLWITLLVVLKVFLYPIIWFHFYKTYPRLTCIISQISYLLALCVIALIISTCSLLPKIFLLFFYFPMAPIFSSLPISLLILLNPSPPPTSITFSLSGIPIVNSLLHSHFVRFPSLFIFFSKTHIQRCLFSFQPLFYYRPFTLWGYCYLQNYLLNCAICPDIIAADTFPHTAYHPWQIGLSMDTEAKHWSKNI